jgi:hypothetical protein
LEGIIQEVGGSVVNEHDLSPTDRWADRESEPMFRNISSMHDHAATETMVSVVIIGVVVV